MRPGTKIAVFWLVLISLPVGALLAALVVAYHKYDSQSRRVLALGNVWDYIAVNHHSRDMTGKWKHETAPSRLIFHSVFEPPSHARARLLIQGDSWAENMSEYESVESRWREYGERNAVAVINAGTTSYSPTLARGQLRYLRNEYRMDPEMIILIVDQSDVGDEACRYAHHIVNDARGNLVRVEPEGVESNEIFNYFRDLSTYAVASRTDLSELEKIFGFYREKVLNRITKWRHTAEMVCGWSAISRWLREGRPAAPETFLTALRGYISEAPRSRCLLIATHPHRAHIEPQPGEASYQADVATLVDLVLRDHGLDERIRHFAAGRLFSSLYGATAIDGVFLADDPASHLTTAAQDIYAAAMIVELESLCTT